jgi:hypothetical protein
LERYVDKVALEGLSGGGQLYMLRNQAGPEWTLVLGGEAFSIIRFLKSEKFAA